MSEREYIQNYFYDYAKQRGFNAPYGVIVGQENFGAKARTLTFGRARTLDLTMRIFNPQFIQVKTSRHGAMVFQGKDAVKLTENFLDTV